MADAVMQARSALAAFDRVGATLLAARTDALLHSLGFRRVFRPDRSLDEVQQFVTEPDDGDATAFSSPSFSPISSLTARAAEMGDHGWRALLDRHDAVSSRKRIVFGVACQIHRATVSFGHVR